MRGLRQVFLQTRWKIFPLFIASFLILISGTFIGRFDPYTGIHHVNYETLINHYLVRIGDDPSWSRDNEVENGKWTRLLPSALPNFFRDDLFWIRASFNVNLGDFENKQPGLFLAGLFSAEVYLNGVFIGRKGTGLEKGTKDKFIPSSVYLEVDPKLLRNGKNNLAIRVNPAEASFFIDPKLQTLSFSFVDNSRINVIFYYFVLAYIFLFALVFLAASIFSYVRKVGIEIERKINLAASSFLNLNIFLTLSWFATGQDLNLINPLILVYSTLIIGTFASFLYKIKYEKLNQKRNLTFVLSFAGISFFSLFIKQEFLLINLTLQGIFYGFAVWKVLVLKPRKYLQDLDYILGFTVFPLLVFYSPYFMASYGVYIFVSVYILFSAANQLFQFIEKNKPKNKPKFLAIYSKGKRHLVEISKVQILSAVRNYTEVIMENNDRHIYHKGLASLMEKMPGNFVRVHRSFAVNMNFVQELLSSPGSRYSISLKTGKNVPVGRVFLANVKEKMM